jgi:hypothetical protein
VPAVHGHAAASTSATILLLIAAAVGVVLLGAFGGLFFLLTRGQDRASRIIRMVATHIRFLDADRFTSLVERLARRFAVLMEDRALLQRAVGWATANWLLDAASLWVFVAAFGHVISPIELLTAYGLANILAAIPLTPGGLGVVEFVLVSMLAGFGLTDGQALSAVLAYRAVNFWLPIPFGGLAYASIELEHRAVRTRVRRSVLSLQSRSVELVTRVFVRTGRTSEATAVSSEASPSLPLQRRGPDPVSTDRSTPRAPTAPPVASTAPPVPHPGAPVVLRAQAVDIDPAG